MKKSILMLLAAAMLLVVTGCGPKVDVVASPRFNSAKYNQIAIVDVVGGAYNFNNQKNAIANQFQMELIRQGYMVIERERVQAILKEQNFQASDITSRESIARAGEILNTPAIVLIDIPRFKDTVSVTVKIVDTENAMVLWMATGYGKSDKARNTAIGVALGAVAGAVVGHQSGEVGAGAVIGGVAGGVTGYALSPSEEKLMQKIMNQLGKQLPMAIF